MRQLVSAFVLASVVLLAPAVAAADQFDTVDKVEPVGTRLTITGMKNGAVARTEYGFNNADALADCKRFALIALTKPGKYSFTIAPYSYCTLALKP